jgi:hypothetical protein
VFYPVCLLKIGIIYLADDQLIMIIYHLINYDVVTFQFYQLSWPTIRKFIIFIYHTVDHSVVGYLISMSVGWLKIHLILSSRIGGSDKSGVLLPFLDLAFKAC